MRLDLLTDRCHRTFVFWLLVIDQCVDDSLVTYATLGLIMLYYELHLISACLMNW